MHFLKIDAAWYNANANPNNNANGGKTELNLWRPREEEILVFNVLGVTFFRRRKSVFVLNVKNDLSKSYFWVLWSTVGIWGSFRRMKGGRERTG